MILKRKLLSLSTIGAAALLVAGPTLAAPPTGFTYGNYEATAGAITNADCAGGTGTCVDLVSGTGLLQRQVTLSTGEQYIQTIVVDDGATTGTGVKAIDQGTGAFNLDFTNETFVGTNTATSGDLATQSSVDLIADPLATPAQGPAPTGNMANPSLNRVVATVDAGNLSTAPGGASHSTVLQQQALDNAGGSTKLWLESMGESSGTSVEANRYLRMDQVVGKEGASPGEQGITVRKSSGLFTVQAGSDTLDLPSGSSQSYATGDDIGVVWLQLNNMGGAGLPGGSADVAFQMQSFTVNGTANAWNSCASGVMGACNNALASGTDWSAYWDAGGNLGTAPTALDASTSNATPTTWFPNFHD